MKKRKSNSTPTISKFFNSGRTTKRKKPSSFVTCPKCSKNIPSLNVNHHLDKCLQSDPAESKIVGVAGTSTTVSADNHVKSIESVPKPILLPLMSALRGRSATKRLVPQRIPGLFLCEDFVSEEEEIELLKHIDNTKPDFLFSKWNGFCLTKHWGVLLDVATRVISSKEQKFPAFLEKYVNRMCEGGKFLPMAGWKPNEVNANKYLKHKGHFLSAHFDDRQLSGELLANISLRGNAEMEYRNPKTKEIVRVYLPRRSLQIVTKESRYSWTHGIPFECLHSDVRVSLTFRCQGSANRFKVGDIGGYKVI
jgi:hypothetical protein